MKIELIISLSIIGLATSKTSYVESNEVLGIDFGTSFVSVGIFRYGTVEIIPNEYGNRMTPTYVLFTETGDCIIGELAYLKTGHNPKNKIYNIKRLLGRTWNNNFVQNLLASVPYDLVNVNNKPYVQVNLRNKTIQFSPEEISAMFLVQMKQLAEKYLHGTIKDAVITVPAYFNDQQRQAVKDASAIAELNVLRLISEPTAAAMAARIHSTEEDNVIFVLDLGGGTVDASIIQQYEGFYKAIATVGNTSLGGENFNERVYSQLVNQYIRRTGKKFPYQKADMKIRREIERAKRALSSVKETMIEINSIYPGEDFSWKLTREHFKHLCKDLFSAIMSLVNKAMIYAKTDTHDITDILLVGGSSKMGTIKDLMTQYFRKSPRSDISPDEAVVYGAAVQAGILRRDNDTDDILLHDIYPMTLGFEAAGGKMAAIIKRNTPIQYRKSHIATTAKDNQPNVEIKVYRGENSLTKDNEFMGKFVLSEIPILPKGGPQIEVTFEIDVDGTLTVTAVDLILQQRWSMQDLSQSIVFKDGFNKLSSSEVSQMRKRIRPYVENEKKRNEKLNIIDELERVIYTCHYIVQEKTDWSDDMSFSAATTEILQQLLDLKKRIQNITNISASRIITPSSNINLENIDIREELEKHVYTLRYIIQINMDWLEKNQDATWADLLYQKNRFYDFVKETIDELTTHLMT
ncbi:endoplasmic reticulum chaperone BiP-like [Mytilus edulis]|uniref:endoplasmic reticulum chaperone BiP-like n=1 Tax=Mytilus edulis TaxID=6550 RepID=UPI0039EFA709